METLRKSKCDSRKKVKANLLEINISLIALTWTTFSNYQVSKLVIFHSLSNNDKVNLLKLRNFFWLEGVLEKRTSNLYRPNYVIKVEDH